MNDTIFGKIALQKLNLHGDEYRVYCAGWLGDHPSNFEVMEVKVAEFRKPSKGPHKDEYRIKVTGTTRTVYVTKAELCEAKDRAN